MPTLDHSSTAPAAPATPASPRTGERLFVVGFIVVGLLGPIVMGERYPFSIAPMFCQQPTCYCEYVVKGPDGDSLDLARFQLQRVYDGNPVGLGVGVRPPETLDRFGEVPTEQLIREHLQQLPDDAWRGLPYVDVEVSVIGDVDGVHVGRIDERSFTVRVTAPGAGS